jgi:hypothetical protein
MRQRDAIEGVAGVLYSHYRVFASNVVADHCQRHRTRRKCALALAKFLRGRGALAHSPLAQAIHVQRDARMCLPVVWQMIGLTAFLQVFQSIAIFRFVALRQLSQKSAIGTATKPQKCRNLVILVLFRVFLHGHCGAVCALVCTQAHNALLRAKLPKIACSITRDELHRYESQHH